MTVLTYPLMRQGEKARLVKTVNIQVLGGSSPWTRPSGPECGDTLKSPAGDQRPIWGWRSSSKTAPGSLSTGSPAGCTLPHGGRLDARSGQHKGR